MSLNYHLASMVMSFEHVVEGHQILSNNEDLLYSTLDYKVALANLQMHIVHTSLSSEDITILRRSRMLIKKIQKLLVSLTKKVINYRGIQYEMGFYHVPNCQNFLTQIQSLNSSITAPSADFLEKVQELYQNAKLAFSQTYSHKVRRLALYKCRWTLTYLYSNYV